MGLDLPVMQIFSTDDVSLTDRFAYWRDVLTQHFIHLRPEPLDTAEFSSSISAREVAGHSFSQVIAGGQRVHRTRSEIARSPYDLVFLNLQVRGRGSYRQGGDEVALAPGDLFLINAVEPFALGCPEPLTQISLKVPRHLLWEKLHHTQNAAGTFIAGASYSAKLIRSYTKALWCDDGAGSTPDNQCAVDHLMDLIAYEINRRNGNAPLPRPAVRAGIYARARHFIKANLENSALTPRTVAAAMGVSLRTLQSIFAENTTSISRQIQHERLEMAARLLADPALRGRKILEIAFMSGFCELSHFTHSFVKAFGEPPGAWRKRKLMG